MLHLRITENNFWGIYIMNCKSITYTNGCDKFMNTIIPAISPLITIVVVVVFAIMAMNWRVRNFDYECETCGARFNLPLSASLISFHMLGRKYVKCPHCGQWSWVNPIPKQNR